jgi:hypothetical protein
MKNKNIYLSAVFVGILATTLLFANHADARGRYGSYRVGGYTSHGKGSHYVGGYVRSVHTAKYYLKH